MQHECAGHPHNGLNRTLSLGILVLSSYTRKCLLLVLLLAIILELIRSENTVVTVDVLDFDKSSISQPILKGLFGNESITCSKRDLVLNPNNASSCIVENLYHHGIYYSLPLGRSLLIAGQEFSPKTDP